MKLIEYTTTKSGDNTTHSVALGSGLIKAVASVFVALVLVVLVGFLCQYMKGT